MKKNLLLMLALVLALASCKTREKIVYLQDTLPNESVPTQKINVLKIEPGDKLGITVTSAATPELAARYNLGTGTTSSTGQANYDNYRYTVDETATSICRASAGYRSEVSPAPKLPPKSRMPSATA